MTYLKNGWYCAGFSHSLSDKPLAVTMLDQPIVLYRLPDGTAAALHDRCPHRFAPLSMGKVVGAAIQCTYHGLEFGADGRCSLNPHGDGVIPPAACVRSYPVEERDTLLWVWMGEAALAAENPAPDLSAFLDDTKSPMIHCYYQAQANYEVVTDNLMDLSHGVYLHPNTLSSDQEQVKKLKIELKQEGNRVSALHSYHDTPPTPLFKPFWTSTDELCDQSLDMHWSAPGTLLLDVGNHVRGESRDSGPWIHSAHILTPISEFETHYFFLATRNFATDSEAVSKGLIDYILYAFTQEDAPVLKAVQQRMGTPDLMSLRPVVLPNDAAPMRVRQMIKKLRREEAALTDAAPRVVA